jgi:hypothetical protein
LIATGEGSEQGGGEKGLDSVSKGHLGSPR